MLAKRAPTHFTIARFSICVELGLVSLLRLCFAHSEAQAVLELVILLPQLLEELR